MPVTDTREARVFIREHLAARLAVTTPPVITALPREGARQYRSRMLRLALCLLAVAALPSAGRAHDFWIEVDAALELQTVGLRVGPDYWPLDAYPRSVLHARRFGVIGPDGPEYEVPGEEGDDPAGAFRAPPGVYAVVYESVGSPIQLEAAKFTHYLEEEGQTDVIAARAASGTSDEPGRERFYRSAKALVHVDGGDGTVDGYYGLPIEIVPLASVEALEAGGRLEFILLFSGRPLPDTRVAAYRWPGGPASVGRTDARGRVTLNAPASGRWLVKAVHMVPGPRRAQAEWHSYWASLTFSVE